MGNRFRPSFREKWQACSRPASGLVDLFVSGRASLGYNHAGGIQRPGPARPNRNQIAGPPRLNAKIAKVLAKPGMKACLVKTTLHCYLPTSSRPAKIFPERGQPCPRVPTSTRVTRGQSCPRSFGCAFAALQRDRSTSTHPAKIFQVRIAASATTNLQEGKCQGNGCQRNRKWELFQPGLHSPDIHSADLCVRRIDRLQPGGPRSFGCVFAALR
jgi:hypothetical protein